MQQYKYVCITRYINLNHSFMTIINVSSKLSLNRVFTPFSGCLQFKSCHSGGLQFLSGTPEYQVPSTLVLRCAMQYIYVCVQ